MENGAADQLKKFLKEAEIKYELGMNEFVHKLGLSIMEFADLSLLKKRIWNACFSVDEFLYPQVLQEPTAYSNT